MSLLIKNVTSDFDDMEAIIKLNDEAFPEEERMKIEEMLQLIEKCKLDILAVYEGDVFIGFYVLNVRRPIAYVFFLAVDKSKRSQGYRSKTLKAMTKQYSEYQIVLNIETMDDKADNYRFLS